MRFVVAVMIAAKKEGTVTSVFPVGQTVAVGVAFGAGVTVERIFFLRDGRLAGVGSFDELLADNAEFRALAT